MLNLKSFDYFLFKDEQGRCFVKIKSTDEIVEINEQVMRLLRSEEKKIYREAELKKYFNSDDIEKKAKASVLYPFYYQNDDCESEDENESESFVLQDHIDFEDELIARDLEKSFVSLLTDSQKEVFYDVMLGGETQRSFAKRKGLNKRAVNNRIELIRKKAKKFFE